MMASHDSSHADSNDLATLSDNDLFYFDLGGDEIVFSASGDTPDDVLHTAAIAIATVHAALGQDGSACEDDVAEPVFKDIPQKERPGKPTSNKKSARIDWDTVHDSLHRNGALFRVQERGDGNCLFRCIARQVFGSPDYHMATRNIICDHIAANPTFFGRQVDGGEAALEEHVRSMRVNAAFGTTAELVAAENIFNRATVVYNAELFSVLGYLQAQQPDAETLPHEFQPTQTTVTPIRVIYANLHFDTVASGSAHEVFPLRRGLVFDTTTGREISIAESRGCVVQPYADPRDFRPPSNVPRPPQDDADTPDSPAQAKKRRLSPRSGRSRDGAKKRRGTAADVVESSAKQQSSHPGTAGGAKSKRNVPVRLQSNANLTSKLYIAIGNSMSESVVCDRIREINGPEDGGTPWRLSTTFAGGGEAVFVVSMLPNQAEVFEQRLREALPTWKIVQRHADPMLVPTWHPNRGSCAIATININSLSGKTADLIDFIERNNVQVCAVQETRRVSASDPRRQIRLPQHNVVEVFADGKSVVGVALLVHRALGHRHINFASQFAVACEVKGLLGNDTAVFASVYIPCEGEPLREEALMDIRRLLAHVNNCYPGCPAVIMGDWNTTAKKLDPIVMASQFDIFSPSESAATRHTSTGSIHRDIDHIVISHVTDLLTPQVDRTWCASDHWPVVSQVIAAVPEPGEQVTVQRRFKPVSTWCKTQEERVQLATKLCNHSAFQKLFVTADGSWPKMMTAPEELNAFAERLVEACWEAALDCKIAYKARVSDDKAQNNPFGLSQKVRDALRDKRVCMRRCVDAETATERQEWTKKAYDAKRAVAVAVQQQRSTTHADLIAENVAAVQRGSKDAWAALKKIRLDHVNPTGLQPLQVNGHLVTEPEQIKQSWYNHFSALFQTNSGLTKDDLDMRIKPSEQRAEVIPEKLTMTDIMTALARMQPGKAPGPDGVPVDLFRLLAETETPITSTPRTLHESGKMNKTGVRSWLIPECGLDCDYYSNAIVLLPDAPVPGVHDLEAVQEARVNDADRTPWQVFRDEQHKKWLDADRKRKAAAAVVINNSVELPVIDMSLDENVPRRQANPPLPRSPLAAALWRLLRAMWSVTHVPPSMRTADLVSILKKNSDPTICGNYRGISLIPACVRILCTICNTYIERVLKLGNVIIPEQAGFREKEEAVAQAAAVYEVVKRRMAAGSITALLFIDFEKAFDRVDHHAIRLNLQKIGIEGPMLEFITELYSTTSLAIRFPDGTRSNVINVNTGVRQGCPMSPTVFKLFINSMVDAINSVRTTESAAGVRVPGYERDRHNFIGGLFADDTVLAVNSVEALSDAIQGLRVWCAENGMIINAAKSGIMICGGSTTRRQTWINRINSQQMRNNLTINGKVIPIISEYTYLGLLFDEQLDRQVMADARLAKARYMLSTLRPTLSDSQLPISVRVDIINVMLVSAAMYGAELWGTNAATVHGQQQLIDEAMRAIIRMGDEATQTAMSTLRRELRIPTMEAVAKSRVHRLWSAAGAKNTWIARCVGTAEASFFKRGTWTSDARRVVQYLSAHDLLKTNSRETRDAIWKYHESIDTAVTLARHRETESEVTTAAQGCYMYPPMLGEGFQLLTRLRCGALVLSKLVTLIGDCAIQSFCWNCRDETREETVEHLLLHCPAWNQDRHILLDKAIARTKHVLHDGNQPATPGNIVTLLLGGSVNAIRIPNWFWVRRGVSTPMPTLQSSPGVVDWRRQTINIRVAMFLQNVWRKRTRDVLRNEKILRECAGIPPKEKTRMAPK